MDQKTLVEQVFHLTQAIEQAAALADWPKAARLVEERSPLLMSITREQNPASLELIRCIQAMDAAISADAAVTRTELESEYRAEMNRVSELQEAHRAALQRVSAAKNYRQIARL